jgi:hypothetical protein
VTLTARSARESATRVLRRLVLLAAIAASAGLTGALIGRTSQSVSGNRMAPWIIGRAAGITSYLLLVALVLLGLGLSHPWRAKIRRPSSAARIRVHIALAVFTLAFTVLHIVVLATDRYAGVGWAGALWPMQASYRPVATTLGLIGVWSGLLAGLTAAFAGRFARRIWWPIHKVSSCSLVLVWLHGVYGGADSAALATVYVGTGALVALVALSRYVARTPADLVAELAP